MGKYFLVFFAGLFVFGGCSDKKKYDKAIFIFEKHSIKKVDSSRVRNLLNQRGFAGLQAVDKYAKLIASGKKIKFYGNNTDIKNIGALFDGNLDNLYVRRVFNNSPAFKNNVRDGDKVLAADYDNDAQDSTGDTVKFKLQRRSAKKPFFVSIKKEKFLFPRIFGFPLNQNTAYVKVGSFFKGSSKIIEQGLTGLIKTGAKSIILDLRYNNGGNINELSRSINLFSPDKKLMFSVKSHKPGYAKDFHSKGKGKFSEVKLIILVNKDTSMSGEIFAQVLKENNKAFIMGSETAGKVSIQKTFKLLRGEGLSITVAKLFPSSGIDISGKGVDIDFKINTQDEKNLKELWLTGSSIVLLKDPYYKEAVKK
ncbi:MAG: hypothetical protein KAI33_09395 [Elusimicrobiales bacterium]|nr:hypothetical protein [Elusimicrobiales bacterium]